ncbi:hypothetical protein EJ06DRAFT_533969 [Trichodelitschia bisporula]|uniref:Uncharacterized protein n=1 Tax=Trichodelitschia bisporula TaxID=703511 RepID=A0A6G1HLJ8_9PEZI|nr:hypothetical protein EJ06DRAFT_533969 [Trichodelitschia bisporula]
MFSTLQPHRPQVRPNPFPAQQTRQYDPATTHPVFFSGTLRKAPAARMNAGTNPAAAGYVVQERREVKL